MKRDISQGSRIEYLLPNPERRSFVEFCHPQRAIYISTSVIAANAQVLKAYVDRKYNVASSMLLTLEDA